MPQIKNPFNATPGKWNQLYFSRLYRHNRKLFYGVLCFVLLTIVCNLAGYEATPFFVWAVYSEKEVEPDFYEVQEVIINDSERVNITTGYTPSTRFLLQSPLWYYLSIKRNNNVDPTISFLQSKLHGRYELIRPFEHILFNDSGRINAFLPWYKRYVEEVTNTKVKSLKIINTRVHYRESKIIEDTSLTIAVWRQ